MRHRFLKVHQNRWRGWFSLVSKCQIHKKCKYFKIPGILHFFFRNFFWFLILHSSFPKCVWTIGCLQSNNKLSNLICNHIIQATDSSDSSLHTCKHLVIYLGMGDNFNNAILWNIVKTINILSTKYMSLKSFKLHYQPKKMGWNR